MKPVIRRGVLRREDLGAGAWMLEADDGTRWQILGEVPEALAGTRVAIEGEPEAAFGFAISAPTLRARQVRSDEP